MERGGLVVEKARVQPGQSLHRAPSIQRREYRTDDQRDAYAALVDRARREVDEGIVPSCQLAVAQDGEVVESITLGEAVAVTTRVTSSSRARKHSSPRRVWQLLAEGPLALDDRIVDHIPSSAANGKDQITLEQVLLHTSGFPHAPLGAPQWFTRDGRLAAFAKWRLNWEPGPASSTTPHRLTGCWPS